MCCWHRAGVPARQGDLRDHRLDQPAGTGRAEAGSACRPERDHIRGSPDAPLTLVEYGDFQCPFCSRATGSIDQVRDHFGDELRYVWRHLPLEQVHPRAFDAARASEAAASQDKFWEMARTMFEHPDDLEWSDIYRYAVTAGCDIERFDKDVRVHASRRCTVCRTTRRTPR